ncbi:hypothetical protein VTK73DRAFT_4899 [Phialemonium thermophilum]|uniref:Adenosine deaminase domain-containing protein n=1 Tax=Phialemonium thermophilum TaxID=223376 RepID=A0ABR3V5Y2_9PEZI
MHDVWIDGNMQKVYTYCGFNKAQMVRLARNGVEMSWAPEDVKRSILEELDAVDTTECQQSVTKFALDAVSS